MGLPSIDGEYIVTGDHLAHIGVGDILTLTAVIREVNGAYPDKKIIVKIVGDKSCFLNNPRIFEIKDEPLPQPQNEAVGGHYIRKKCLWFGVEPASYRTELFIDDDEFKEAQNTISGLSQEKPVVMFSPNSRDARRDWTPENWEKLVNVVNSKYDVYQIDRIEQNAPVWDALAGNLPATATDPQRTIPGARQELRGVEWRKAMALMKVSGKYLGTNTGFLPMANAFGADHFVFHDTRFVNPSEWEYPDNHNFYQTDSIESVIDDIKKHWLQ